jgi:hypothetical protein
MDTNPIGPHNQRLEYLKKSLFQLGQCFSQWERETLQKPSSSTELKVFGQFSVFRLELFPEPENSGSRNHNFAYSLRAKYFRSGKFILNRNTAKVLYSRPLQPQPSLSGP